MASLSKKPFISKSDFIPEEIVANILARLPVKSLCRFKCVSKSWLSLISSPRYFFPEGIIEDILRRLPVKSLLRFKCVSKQWLSLISSPSFVKIHFQSQSQRIMIYPGNPTHSLMDCSSHSLIFQQVTEATNNDFSFSEEEEIRVIGSCNGLLLLSFTDFIQDFDLFLWNPSTRISLNLPPPNIAYEDIYWVAFGLGYNESKDDYVVVSITAMDGGSGSLVNVYSSRTDSWRRIGDFNIGHPVNSKCCKFVAGKFHLCTCPVDGYHIEEDPGPPTLFDIVSFDVENEAYEFIGHPNYGAGVVALSLGELGGRLCVLSSKEIHADLWVMSEYGVVESWTKKVTIPYVNYSIRSLYLKPLVMLQSRKILLVQKLDYVEHQVLRKQHFVVYDPNDNSLRVPETVNFGNFEEAGVYVESLVWPTMDLDE